MNFIYSVLEKILKFFAFLNKHIKAFADCLPVPDKVKRCFPSLTVAVGLLLIVALILLIIVKPFAPSPNAQGGGAANAGNPDAVNNPSLSEELARQNPYINSGVLSETLPEKLDNVPKNDKKEILQIPTGGIGWRFTDAEIFRLQRLMACLEKAESFEYESDNKSAAMAKTALWDLINSGIVTYRENDNKLIAAPKNEMDAVINGFFGRNISTKANLGDIFFTSGHYNQQFDPTYNLPVSGYIMSSYSLGQDYYKISGIVTRGFPSDAGAYSRQLSVILMKNDAAKYGYYVISLANEPIAYTYLDSLTYFANDKYSEDSPVPRPITSIPSVPYTTSEGNEEEPDENTEEPIESEEPTTDITSEPPVTSDPVSLPPAEGDTVKLSNDETKSVNDMLWALPNIISDFDVSNESYAVNTKLLSHLLICDEKSIDYKMAQTMLPMTDIIAKAKSVFGTPLPGVENAGAGENFTLEPYIITGKTEFNIVEVRRIDDTKYLLICDAAHFSNSMLENADMHFTYTAVIEKNDSALYKFYLKSQKFEQKNAP